jgi:hypothetical protein
MGSQDPQPTGPTAVDYDAATVSPVGVNDVEQKSDEKSLGINQIILATSTSKEAQKLPEKCVREAKKLHADCSHRPVHTAMQGLIRSTIANATRITTLQSSTFTVDGFSFAESVVSRSGDTTIVTIIMIVPELVFPRNASGERTTVYDPVYFSATAVFGNQSRSTNPGLYMGRAELDCSNKEPTIEFRQATQVVDGFPHAIFDQNAGKKGALEKVGFTSVGSGAGAGAGVLHVSKAQKAGGRQEARSTSPLFGSPMHFDESESQLDATSSNGSNVSRFGSPLPPFKKAKTVGTPTSLTPSPPAAPTPTSLTPSPPGAPTTSGSAMVMGRNAHGVDTTLEMGTPVTQSQ